jgi:hypothetical protein
LKFSVAAPGALTPAGDSYVGEWSVSPDNYGHSVGEVEAWVASALNDAEGWTKTGISFDQVASGGGVVFRSVAALAGNAIGMCYYDTDPPRVELLSSYFENMDLVNHEAAHAFFYAAHSPDGSESIMEPIEDPGEEWPSETDLQQVASWLSLPYPPGGDVGSVEVDALAPGLYWHPVDLGGYKTRWDLSEASEVRLTLPVMDARSRAHETGPTLSAVYSLDQDAPITDWLPLGASVESDGIRVHDSDWSPVAVQEDVFVAMTLEVPLPLDSLTMGAAELRWRA